MKANSQNPARHERGTFPFGEGTRILDIRYDPVFKAVFTRDTSNSRLALSDLISALIGRVVSVETIVANEPASGFLGQKKIRYDIACISKNSEPVNVEMSFHPIDDELNRLEYFASRLFVGQDIQGIDKAYSDLKETYQISILAQKSFFPNKNLTHTFQFYDPHAHVSLDGKMRIITLELEKSAAFIDKPAEEMSNAELWAAYFQYLTNEAKREKIKKIIDREEGIAMATDALYQVTADEEEYARLTSLMKGELDWRSGMRDAERKASLDIARKLKGMGLSISQIAEGTGLSTETISQL
jgi:predicted transposase/invertase (TIGR01784 family)